MLYAVKEHKPGVLLVGSYGTGKTLLSRSLAKECSSDKYKVVSITNPRLSPLELLAEINYQLGAPFDPSRSLVKIDLLHSLSKLLEDNYIKGIFTVIIVDEAQSIENNGLMEELRLLLNIQHDDAVLFTLCILGQPTILEVIEAIPQFKQRLLVRFRLKALDLEQTKKYIQHRIEIAGLRRDIFTDSAYEQIFDLSEGIPRSINNICDIALLSGYIKNIDSIDKEIVIDVFEDLEHDYKNLIQKDNSHNGLLPNIQKT